jgi:hypothetical protein
MKDGDGSISAVLEMKPGDGPNLLFRQRGSGSSDGVGETVRLNGDDERRHGIRISTSLLRLLKLLYGERRRGIAGLIRAALGRKKCEARSTRNNCQEMGSSENPHLPSQGRAG